MRYVDDTLFACEESTIKEREEETSRIFVQPPLEDPNGKKFVGSTLEYEVIEELDGGHKVYSIQWNQTELIDEMVEKYEEKYGTVPVRSTPAPASDEHVPKTREQEARECAKEAPYVYKAGLHKEDCQEYIGSTSYVEQHTRPDISVANHTLQQNVAAWDEGDDRLLKWLIGYMKGTAKDKLTGYVSTKDFAEGKVRQIVQTDASHAGCRDTRMSTCGYAIYLVGPRTKILLSWGTKRLSTVSLSSCESELFGAQHGSKIAIYVKLIVDGLRGHVTSILPQYGDYNVNDKAAGIEETLELDAEAALKAIRNANSTKLRHVRRTLGISLAWLHKKWCNREESNMKHRKGTDLSADSQTKNLSKGPLQTMKDLLGLKS